MGFGESVAACFSLRGTGSPALFGRRGEKGRPAHDEIRPRDTDIPKRNRPYAHYEIRRLDTGFLRLKG